MIVNSFKKYVGGIMEEHTAKELSYFEMNLETWRQLWRVLEISDVLLLIVDVRTPVSPIKERMKGVQL